MMNTKTAIDTLLFIILLVSVACNRDQIDFHAPSENFRFSKDTLVLDTVYNQVRSETYLVKVYNQENKDLMIPKISLKGGGNSPYKLNIDGRAGTNFSNIPLRKKDSLYIFVEIAPLATTTEAIAEDKILFSTGQHITLLSVVQDAEFFVQTSNHPNILSENTTWNNQKAKIIYGDLIVAEGKTLTIEKGTKIYFAKNSGLKVLKNGKLNIHGDLGEEVILRGKRNDPRYDTIPLNWNSIRLEEGATAQINYAKIFGGSNGLEIQKAKAKISNTLIYNFQNYGIKTLASEIDAQNVVMNHCGESTLGIFKGGNISLTHCTLANYWQMNSSLPGYSLSASNEWENPQGKKEYGPLYLNIQNSILYTGKNGALSLNPTDGQVFSYNISHSLFNVKAQDLPYYQNNSNLEVCIINKDPKFNNYHLKKMNLRVTEDSPAKTNASVIWAQIVPEDIVKKTRTVVPTIGAYQ